MIIVKSPFRVSFFGGGTDFPEWFNKFEGKVISSAIDYYSYLLIKDKDINKFKYNFNYSKIENTNSLSSISHPCFRKFCKNFKIKDIDLTFYSDLPSFSGLASSSSLSVGLINFYNTVIKNKKISRNLLALKTIDFERNILKENIGYQDQISISYGGINYIKFKNDSFKCNKIYLTPKKFDKFEKNFFLLDSGIKRFSSIIQKNLIRNFEKSRIKNKYLSEMMEYVDLAKKFIQNNKFEDFGSLLDSYWNLKILSNPSAVNDEIKIIYNLAIKNGALGGKLLGAGSGGFFLFYVPKKNQVKFKKMKKKFRIVPFKISHKGSEVFRF